MNDNPQTTQEATLPSTVPVTTTPESGQQNDSLAHHPLAAQPVQAPTLSESHQFFDKSTPDEFKSQEWYQNIFKAENPHVALLKSFEGQAKLIGKRSEGGIQLPGEGATADQWNDFFKSVGRPDQPDAYVDPTIEWGDDQKEAAAALAASRPESFMQDMKVLAHKAGLTPAQFAYLSENYDRVFLHHNAAEMGRVAQERQAQNVEFSERAQAIYGDSYLKVMTDGGATAAKVLDPQLKPLLDKAGKGESLTGNEALLLFSGVIHGMNKTYLKQDTLNPKGGSSAPMTKEDIQTESLRILNSEAFKNPMDPGHQGAVAQWNNLFAPKAGRK